MKIEQKNFIREYYKFDKFIKVSKPAQEYERIPFNKINTKIDFQKEYTRDEINKIIAELIIEDYCPNEYIDIEYTTYKISEYKKRKDSNIIRTIEGYYKRFQISEKVKKVKK